MVGILGMALAASPLVIISVTDQEIGRYLDLSIPACPNEVRSQSGVFLLSGDRAAYGEHHGWFERISRTATFVDEAPGAAYLTEMAVLLACLPMAVGLSAGDGAGSGDVRCAACSVHRGIRGRPTGCAY